MRENGEEPKIEAIAKELEVKIEDIVFCLDAIQDTISLHEPVYSNGLENVYIMDQIQDSKNTEDNWSEHLTISNALDKLNDKEKTIITKRFFQGRTQIEIAEEIGISQAQVSRIEKNAIKNIKKRYI